MASRENLNPHALTRITRELQKMVSEPQSDGIRIIVNERDLTDIQADIEGPTATPYEGGIFRCKLVIGSEFPAAPPRGLFLTKIFHPNVAPNGEICVNTLKKDWTPDVGLMHVLQVIRCLLIVPFPESALNEEASRLFLESYEEYARRAALMTSVHATAKGKSREASSSDRMAHEGDGEKGSNEEEVDNAAAPAPKIAKSLTQKKSTRSALKRL